MFINNGAVRHYVMMLFHCTTVIGIIKRNLFLVKFIINASNFVSCVCKRPTFTNTGTNHNEDLQNVQCNLSIQRA